MLVHLLILYVAFLFALRYKVNGVVVRDREYFFDNESLTKGDTRKIVMSDYKKAVVSDLRSAASLLAIDSAAGFAGIVTAPVQAVQSFRRGKVREGLAHTAGIVARPIGGLIMGATRAVQHGAEAARTAQRMTRGMRMTSGASDDTATQANRNAAALAYSSPFVSKGRFQRHLRNDVGALTGMHAQQVNQKIRPVLDFE